MGTDDQGGTGRIDVTIDEDRPPTRTDHDAVGGARNKDPIEAPDLSGPFGPGLVRRRPTIENPIRRVRKGFF